MIYDFLWKISSLFIRFLRIFDRDITASCLWKVRVRKLTNCWPMPLPLFQYTVNVGCAYNIKLHGEDEEAYATMSTQAKNSVRMTDINSKPRVTIKLYFPFKTARSTVQLKIGQWVEDHEEYLSKTVSLDEHKPGIYFIEIFVEDLISHYKERGYSP